ncbi:hypothetical protein Q0590_34255 [Rhodocytophaga aerolata]|uniref:Glyoxalase n=1 Tax=Rhodocytophaga aerolata TaxID=455078 RepID=A0ABT8RJ20_9BACT|nr:hypothetical protein [Rhodocytophaga aerolata]MDO1451389.1 hypothetical protein [Rhodocytophaga aerolata]
MRSPESINQSAQFLNEHRQVLTLEVFEHASEEYRIYLDKLISRRNAVLEEELTEKTFRQLRAMEEQLKVLLGFYGIVEMTLKILSEEAMKSLNFDAHEWSRYKLIEQENAMLMAFIEKKLKQQDGS